MLWRQRKLVALYDELGSIALLDRLREYATDSEIDNDAYDIRQQRRAEILSEITKLKAKQPWFEAHAKGLSVALLLCATAYATFYFLVR